MLTHSRIESLFFVIRAKAWVSVRFHVFLFKRCVQPGWLWAGNAKSKSKDMTP